MQTVQGIYDGKKVQLLWKNIKKKKYKVIITFVEEIWSKEESELRDFSSDSSSFDFWNDKKEDLYQDYLTK